MLLLEALIHRTASSREPAYRRKAKPQTKKSIPFAAGRLPTSDPTEVALRRTAAAHRRRVRGAMQELLGKTIACPEHLIRADRDERPE
jgi:hypothetical protein